MTGSLILALGLPLLAIVACSFVLELLLKPRPVAPWQRPPGALGIHVGLLITAYALELMLFRRPVFAALNVLSIQAVLVLVSNAKFSALREPFVYPDFEYFTDAVRHPRLYLPFFGRLKAAAAVTGYGVLLWAGLTFEVSLASADGAWTRAMSEWRGTTVPDAMSFGAFMVAAMAVAVAGVVLCRSSARLSAGLGVTFDADADLVRLGFLAALWRYGEEERRTLAGPNATAASPFAASAPEVGQPVPNGMAAPDGHVRAPDLVVIQSESFFDARRSFDTVRPDVLAAYDRLRGQACQFGTLKVAAWGANTVRTEFAFLSGLDPATLGVHRFNPYRRLARHGVATIASAMQAQGYRTICVHPYPDSFYTRHLVYPKMGFDTFLDIRAFAEEPPEAGAARGPYVSDAAVARKIRALLGEDTRDARPLFIFAITMENHGPLHWETVDAADAERLFTTPPVAAAQDLVAYVRHLKNADAMFDEVASALRAGSRPGGLCIYGDHVPIMPAVYTQMGEPNGLTDYLIWRSHNVPPAPLRRDVLPVNHLALQMLAHCGAGARRDVRTRV